MELFVRSVDVLLIDFISQNEDLVIIAELDDVLESLVGYDLASRIARVDDGECLNVDKPSLSLLVLFL